MRNELWIDKILLRYTNTRIADGEITGGITIGTDTAYCNRTMEDGRASTCWFVTVHGLQDSNVCIYKHCVEIIKSRLCQAILITIDSFFIYSFAGVSKLFHSTAHFAQVQIYMAHKTVTTDKQISEKLFLMVVLGRLSYFYKARKKNHKISWESWHWCLPASSSSRGSI